SMNSLAAAVDDGQIPLHADDRILELDGDGFSAARELGFECTEDHFVTLKLFSNEVVELLVGSHDDVPEAQVLIDELMHARKRDLAIEGLDPRVDARSAVPENC